jgi:hypothetical protein
MTVDGTAIAANFTTPVIPNSGVPAILGNNALRKNNAVVDFGTCTLHLRGKGNEDQYRDDIIKALPAGSKSIQCEISPSGHLVIPIDHYDSLPPKGGLAEKTMSLPVTEEAGPSGSSGSGSYAGTTKFQQPPPPMHLDTEFSESCDSYRENGQGSGSGSRRIATSSQIFDSETQPGSPSKLPRRSSA